jgi:RNA polymerase sigma-70 factor (ECF subfamily)
VPTSTSSDASVEFERLLAPHLPTAVAYANAIIGNRHDAEDAVQDAVLKGIQAFGSFQISQPFKPWWLTILRNTCKDYLRRSRRWLRVIEGWVRTISQSSAESRSDHEEVTRVLQRLPRQQREIIELKYLAGCTYAEIAAILNIPIGTVMSRLHSARTQFAHFFRKETP